MSGGYDRVPIEFPWGATLFGIARAGAEHRARGRANRLNASGAVHPDFMHTVRVPKDATRFGTSSRKSLLKNRKKKAIARGAHPTPDWRTDHDRTLECQYIPARCRCFAARDEVR